MVNFLLKKIFRRNINDAISLAEIDVTLIDFNVSQESLAVKVIQKN